MPTPITIDQLIRKASNYLSPNQVESIQDAFKFAALAHQGQTRKAGGDYVWHPVAVAEILAEIQLDHESLIAAILHDVVEDTAYNKQDIIDRFGESVAEIVDGVTKLGKVKFENPQEAQAESFRKMILAMSRDIRVILIKLADRLHNMRTLGVMRADKQRRIAKETLDIYAPIAARLGINAIRIELEDLGFKAMYPYRFSVLERAVQKAKGNRTEVVNRITDAITNRLAEDKISVQVLGREKHLYSLYKKMKYKKLNFDEILDIFAFRIVTHSADDCYRALGSIHALYKPFPGRFKDYIAIPKPNGYQSLHTVVFGPFRAYIEVQIRTHIMQEVSEHGIAAHWLYKDELDEGSQPNKEKALSAVELRAQEWVKNLLEIQQSAGNSLDFLENVKIDLFPNVIYVFTPNGDIITLPKGATPIDFAYAVHSNVGNATVGCRIDKKLAPLRTKLESGQTIEIIKSVESQPNPNWLNFVATAKARSQIRAFLKGQQVQSATLLGEKLLSKALRTFNMSYLGLTDDLRASLVTDLKLESWHQLEEEIGLGKRFATLVAKQIHDLILGSDDIVETFNQYSPSEPLAINGTEGMVIHYAQCCHPIPGDEIMGFISAEKGLVIHRQECSNVKNFKNHPDKWLDADWGSAIEQVFDVELVIEAKNQRGTLATIASNIAASKTDIDRVRSEDKDESYSLMYITIKVKDRNHLADIIKKLKRLSIVEKIHRL